MPPVTALIHASASVCDMNLIINESLVYTGRLTTAYTIGGFFGPWLGGVLGSTGDYYLGAKYD